MVSLNGHGFNMFEWLESCGICTVLWASVPGNVSRLVVDEADRMLAAWQRCL